MKPIICNTPMVKALLNTKPNVFPAEPIDASKPRKSQTRRVIEPQPEHLQYHEYKGKLVHEHEHRMWCFKDFVVPDEYIFDLQDKLKTDMSPLCKYARYKVGDILYVRETTALVAYGNEDRMHERIVYKADDLLPSDFERDNGDRWIPSIHMPREAARIFLEVKSVRVERLQDITEADAKAEGSFLDRCECLPRKNDKTPIDKLFSQTQCMKLHGYEFKVLWNSIYAKRGYSWESNPWVFCYSFMRVENPKEATNGRDFD